MTRDPMFDLSGRIALVTGGSRGLGGAIAHGFAAHGADIVIASRKLEACRALADDLVREHGVRALGLRCNVGSWDDCDALVEQATSELGPLDVLVNNAGISPRYPSIVEVTEALYDKVLSVNLKGPFRLSALVGSRMAHEGGGSIVNISSTTSIRPGADALPYAVAKGGLNVLTEGLAQAFGPDVRVNALIAGPFRTDVSKAWTEPAERQMRSALALRRIAAPDEIVGAALFLASDASSFCTGALLRVDGGAR